MVPISEPVRPFSYPATPECPPPEGWGATILWYGELPVHGITLEPMRCPNCGQDDTRVIDSRPADGGGSVRRRRVCATCEARFTTYERVEAPLLVSKREGATEPFDVSKVARGVGAALADRPIPSGAVSALVADIEEKVRAHNGPVPTETIGHWVLEGLRTLDEVAYLRFASVYKEFQGAADFEREMAALESSLDDK